MPPYLSLEFRGEYRKYISMDGPIASIDDSRSTWTLSPVLDDL